MRITITIGMSINAGDLSFIDALRFEDFVFVIWPIKNDERTKCINDPPYWIVSTILETISILFLEQFIILVVWDNNVHKGQQKIFLIAFFIHKLIHQNTVNDSINITTLFDVHQQIVYTKRLIFFLILNLCMLCKWWIS